MFIKFWAAATIAISIHFPVLAQAPGERGDRTVGPTSSTRVIKEKEQQIANPRFNQALQRELVQTRPFSKGIESFLKDNDLKTVAPVPVWDLQDTWSAWCAAEWNERCDGFQEWSPPAGWDICRYNVVEESKAHGEWQIVVSNERMVRVHLKSWGSQAFFDRWGGWVRVKMVTAQLIPTSSTPEQRAPLNCSYANGSGGAGQGMTEYLFCAADPFSTDSAFGVQMCADYTFENGQKKIVRGPYACGVCFKK